MYTYIHKYYQPLRKSLHWQRNFSKDLARSISPCVQARDTEKKTERERTEEKEREKEMEGDREGERALTSLRQRTFNHWDNLRLMIEEACTYEFLWNGLIMGPLSNNCYSRSVWVNKGTDWERQSWRSQKWDLQVHRNRLQSCSSWNCHHIKK